MRVLGVYDRSTGNFRLRAAEPRADGPHECFNQLVAKFPTWVKRGTRIMSDMFIDNDRIRSMGYEVKIQNTSGSGRHIMDYLKKIVPKMFQVIHDIYRVVKATRLQKLSTFRTH